jgi:hypothetical protein
MTLVHDWKDRKSAEPVQLEPHQDRVLEEHEELDRKLEALHVFIEDSTTFRHLGKFDQRLLVDQRHAMTVYRDILRGRIKRFQKENHEPNRS